jgi:hypothetical protein
MAPHQSASMPIITGRMVTVAIEVSLFQVVCRQSAGILPADLAQRPDTQPGPMPATTGACPRNYDTMLTLTATPQAAGGDEVFQQLVLARIIEPTSKPESLRVLEEVGVASPVYRTLTRRLTVFATESWWWRKNPQCAVSACTVHTKPHRHPNFPTTPKGSARCTTAVHPP